jgi:hypothetical protein
MIECKILKSVVYDGESYRPGQTAEFAPADAEGLAADGVVELPKGTKKKPPAKTADTESPPAVG